MIKAQKILSQARTKVKGDVEKLYRINRAGMGLDRLLGFELTREYKAQHQIKDDGLEFPLDIKAAQERFFSTWEKSCKRNGGARNKAKLLKRLTKLKDMPSGYQVSEKFKKVKHLDIPASEIKCRVSAAKLKPDPDAETGSAVVIDADSNPKRYKYPIIMGIYDVSNKTGVVSRTIYRPEVGGEGYFWYKIPNVKLPEANCFMYLSQSWGAQKPINNVGQLDKSKPLDIFVRMKLEGPMYLGGAVASNRIYFDRIIVTQINTVKNPNK